MKYLNSMISAAILSLIVGCGLKVGNVDVGKIASSSAEVLTGGKLSEKEQQQIGDDMAAILLGTAPLNKRQNLQKYVNKVGRWVALQSDSATKSWQFMIIDSADFNAFSTPSAKIIISSGVLARLENEAQFAGVLAHEVAHVELRHQVHAIEKSKVYSGLGSLAFTAADAKRSQSGGYNQNALRNRKIAEGLFNMTHELYTKGLGRDDEFAADRRAVLLMARAGYDPYAYLEVLKVLESVDAGKKALLLATHPKIDDRLKVVSQMLAGMQTLSSSMPVLASRYQKMLGDG